VLRRRPSRSERAHDVRKKSRARARPARRVARPAQRPARRPKPPALRWNPDPEDVQRSVVKLVLSLIEFIRKLMERQAIRRLEEDTLTPAEVENVGIALMKLEQTIQQIAKRFKLDPKDLNLDLGPVGRLH
jgi:hypothetical protein